MFYFPRGLNGNARVCQFSSKISVFTVSSNCCLILSLFWVCICLACLNTRIKETCLIISSTRGDGFSPPLLILHQTISCAYGSRSCCDLTELTVEGSNCVLSGEPHCLNTCVVKKEVELSGRSMQSLLTATCSWHCDSRQELHLFVFEAFWYCSRGQLQLDIRLQ